MDLCASVFVLRWQRSQGLSGVLSQGEDELDRKNGAKIFEMDNALFQEHFYKADIIKVI